MRCGRPSIGARVLNPRCVTLLCYSPPHHTSCLDNYKQLQVSDGCCTVLCIWMKEWTSNSTPEESPRTMFFKPVRGKKKLIFSLIFTYGNSGDRSELLKTKVVRPLYNLGKGIGAFVGPIRVSDMVFFFFCCCSSQMTAEAILRLLNDPVLPFYPLDIALDVQNKLKGINVIFPNVILLDFLGGKGGGE